MAGVVEGAKVGSGLEMTARLAVNEVRRLGAGVSSALAYRGLLRTAALGVLSAFAWVTVAPATAHAQDDASEASEEPKSEASEALARAAEMEADLRYEEARQELMRAIRKGGAHSKELSELYFQLGAAEAALDHDVEATDSFYLAIILSPQRVLPEGGSPKIRQYLNAARDRVIAVGALEARAELREGRLRVAVSNDPVSLVRKARVAVKGGDEPVTQEFKRSKLELAVDESAEGASVVLLDERGNEVRVLEVTPSALAIDSGAGRPWYKTWGLWAGVAVVFGAGGGYFTFSATDKQREIDSLRSNVLVDEDAVASLRDEKDQAQLMGIAGLAVGGLAAVTSGVFFFDSRPRASGGGDSASSTAPSIGWTPVVGKGQLGANMHWNF